MQDNCHVREEIKSQVAHPDNNTQIWILLKKNYHFQSYCYKTAFLPQFNWQADLVFPNESIEIEHQFIQVETQ